MGQLVDNALNSHENRHPDMFQNSRFDVRKYYFSKITIMRGINCQLTVCTVVNINV